MNEAILPKWAKEITRFLSVKSQFVLWGNVYDVYPIEYGGSVVTLRMSDYLRSLLKESGYALILSYEPLYGFRLLEGNPELYREVAGGPLHEPGRPCTLAVAAQLIEQLAESAKAHTAVIMNFASRLPDIAKTDIEEFLYKTFRLTHTASPRMVADEPLPKFNPLIWIVDKENDLPAWFALDNSRVKVLPVPKPDYEVRKLVVTNISRNLQGFAAVDEKRQKETLALFIDQTSGLHASEIIAIAALATREKVAFTDIGDAIRMYKLGIIENPWAKLDLEKIANSEAVLANRVKGQVQAIRKASDSIKRAVFNLSGSQYSRSSQRPKGVLFFAGPTGVGKTELAKTITEMLFSSETNYIRFDMSEFAHEHADQRLIGSPPGYVGYDVGGQLTNAIKQTPFSVVLFDEIEKAHPRILDIFLQILDDGRLTSGRGETVYFSESLIVFTSNLGIYEQMPDGRKVQRVSPDMQYDAIRTNILEAIEDFFKYKIVRPEILNRIGQNIVVFDFIRPEVGRQIFGKMLQNVLFKLTDSYGILLELDELFRENLAAICCADLSMGGRGVGNMLEDAFINPLSRSLFTLGARQGDTVRLSGITKSGATWELTAEKK